MRLYLYFHAAGSVSAGLQPDGDTPIPTAVMVLVEILYLEHMKSVLFFLALILFCFPERSNGQGSIIDERSEHEIAPGITWTRIHTTEYFNVPQFINLVKIDTRAHVEVTLAYSDERKHTSRIALENEALIALNGGFFNMKHGGSVTYMKIDGTVIDSIPATGKLTEQGAFQTRPTGIPGISWSRDVSDYSNDRLYDDVLLTGPMLIREGTAVPLDTTNPFITDRHPRSCACLDSNENLILIAVDGRHLEAFGMSIPELQEFVFHLGCKQAVNFDGGGSTTLWIKGAGVVNHPSDNHQFDSGGERPVANALLIKEKPFLMDERLTIITLGVKDLEKSTRFYSEQFGWNLAPASNEFISMFRLNGILLSLYPHEALAMDAGIEPGNFGAGGFAIAYNTRSKQEVDQIIEKLGSQGVEIIRHPEKTSWGGYSSYVCDPDGYLWEIAYNPFLPLDLKGNVTDQ